MNADFEELITKIAGKEWGLYQDDKLVLGREVEGKRYRVLKGFLITASSLTLEQINILRKVVDLFYKTRKLQRDSVALEGVMEVAGKLSASVGWKETLNEVLRAIKSLIPGKYFSIFLLDRGKKEIFSISSYGYKRDEKEFLHMKYGLGLVGWVIKHGKPLIIEDVRKERRYYKVKEDTLSEMVVPIRAGDKIIGAINVEDDKLNSFTEREKRLLEAFASIAGIVIERARLYSSLVEHKLTLKELEVARRIQFHFLPRRSPRLKDYVVYGKTIPAKKVGGDYFNFRTRGRNVLITVIADVSGKGIPAALLMSFFHSALLIYLCEKELRDTVISLNRLFLSQTEENQFITGIIGQLNRKEGVLKYVNFGHNYPIGVKNGRAEVIEGSDIVVGVMKDADFTVRTFDFNTYDAVYFYTDGVVEQSCKDEEFGLERFKRLIEKHWKSPSMVIKALLDEMEDMCGDERDDDLTIIGIVRNAGN